MAVVSIIATVRLRPPAAKQKLREHWEQHGDSFPGPDWLLAAILDPDRDADRLELLVRLSARDDTGRQIDADGSLGLNGHVSMCDIEEGINRMLGRDPTLHRPPRLAWQQLIAALAANEIHVGEDELIEIPLTVELDQEVTATLEAT
jgi:hypothetical protein